EDDYIMTRDILDEIDGLQINLNWAYNADSALEMIKGREYDVYLLDYRLGEHDGIELLEEIKQFDGKGPVIMLTGVADREIDLRAKKAGASDYLEKGKLDAAMLDRSIRYAIENMCAMEEIKKREEALRKSEQKLVLHIEQTPLGVIEWNTAFEITAWNQSVEKIFGYTQDELMGKHAAGLIFPSSALKDVEKVWEKLLAQKGGTISTNENIRKDGTIITCEWCNTPLIDGLGEVIGVASFVQDVTEQKKTGEELKKAKAAAEAANLSKSEFLAGMSHEIRTPMNAILGMSELLSESELTAEQREYVKRFRRAGDALLSIINDILDFSKIEAGLIKLENINFDLEEFMEDIVQMMGDTARDKKLELICHIEKDVPMALKGDPYRLRQILINLIGNAIKFTHEGDVLLSVEVVKGSDKEKKEDNFSNFLISVRDTGIGIPAEKLASIFESFTQADSSTTRKYGGTGLGLAICKKMAQILGGKIWVESKVGEGSAFYILIPLQLREGEESEVKKIKSDLNGIKVLVIDDNATNRMILKDGLTDVGANVLEAANGKEGLEILSIAAEKKSHFNIVLLDNYMPGMDGPEMMTRLADGGVVFSNTVFIMLSSVNCYSDFIDLKKVGISACLMKPVRMADIVKTVSRILGRYDLLNPVSDGARSLHILLVDDSEDNRLLIEQYLKKSPHTLHLAINGKEAVEKFITGTYDLVLMDMQMPIMDGYTATREIRKWEEEQGVQAMPIIAFTAHALKEEIRKSIDAGCDEHMTKPVKKTTLLETISKYGCTKGE
ncbi:response regulator, partial [bacterium]|nr:response regulator [bacterium]